MKKYLTVPAFFIVSTIILTACNGGRGEKVSGSPDTISPSHEKAITSFSFMSPGTTGIITDSAKTIDLTVPPGTDATVLVAAFTVTGESVTIGDTHQISGITPNDFSLPLEYTVTAADGSTEIYTVYVTIALDSSKSITGFSLLEVQGIIDDTAKTITISLPAGTNPSGLIAEYTATGESVQVGETIQESGTTPNDFSQPLEYTVTAADGSTEIYTVIVITGHVVINEISTRGLSSGYDEFIELYNASNAEIGLGTYSLWYRSSGGTMFTNLNANWGADKKIPAGRHFLLGGTNSAGGYSGPVSQDGSYTARLSDTGGSVWLMKRSTPPAGMGDSDLVDMAGWGSAVPGNYEGSGAAPSLGASSSEAANKSIERISAGQDTGDNSADFFLRSARDPQNLSSP